MLSAVTLLCYSCNKKNEEWVSPQLDEFQHPIHAPSAQKERKSSTYNIYSMSQHENKKLTKIQRYITRLKDFNSQRLSVRISSSALSDRLVSSACAWVVKRLGQPHWQSELQVWVQTRKWAVTAMNYTSSQKPKPAGQKKWGNSYPNPMYNPQCG